MQKFFCFGRWWSDEMLMVKVERLLYYEDVISFVWITSWLIFLNVFLGVEEEGKLLDVCFKLYWWLVGYGKSSHKDWRKYEEYSWFICVSLSVRHCRIKGTSFNRWNFWNVCHIQENSLLSLSNMTHCSNFF
jgi:hypothetical protein